jgi:hypothetical protein
MSENDFFILLSKNQEIYTKRRNNGDDVGFFLFFKNYTFIGNNEDQYCETERIICVKDPDEIEINGEFLSFSYLVSTIGDTNKDSEKNESIRISKLVRIVISVFSNRDIERKNLLS